MAFSSTRGAGSSRGHSQKGGGTTTGESESDQYDSGTESRTIVGSGSVMGGLEP